ncbi:MAG: hypothetical protein WC216_12245, partial [Gallionella sp.]
MSREAHVQFCESVEGRFLCATHRVVLCAGAVDAPLATVRQVLDRLDLTLNETKTRIVDARQESF